MILFKKLTPMVKPSPQISRKFLTRMTLPTLVDKVTQIRIQVQSLIPKMITPATITIKTITFKILITKLTRIKANCMLTSKFIHPTLKDVNPPIQLIDDPPQQKVRWAAHKTSYGALLNIASRHSISNYYYPPITRQIMIPNIKNCKFSWRICRIKWTISYHNRDKRDRMIDSKHLYTLRLDIEAPGRI